MPFLRVVANQKLHTNDVVNAFAFTGQDATLGNALAIADELRDMWLDTLSPHMAVSWSLEDFTFYDLEAAPGTPGLNVVPTSGGIVGVDPADSLPNQIAMLVSTKTLDGPPWRGRIYLTGWTTTAMSSNGRFANTTTNAATDFTTRMDLIDFNTGLSLSFGVWSTTVVGSASDKFGVVNSYQSRANPATQRRRRQGSGS